MALEILAPDLGGPMTNGEEILQVTGVSLDVVDGSVMLTLLKTELQVDFDLLSFVGLQDVTLFSSNQVLEWRGIRVVLQ